MRFSWCRLWDFRFSWSRPWDIFSWCRLEIWAFRSADYEDGLRDV